MRLTDILPPECVKVPLKATDKHAAIDELVDLLADHADIAARQDLKDAVWQREQTRTTGIGHGIGIPHGKSPGCQRLVMAVGKTAEPIEFGAIDGKPVQLVLLLASPVDQTGPHIQALAAISRMLTNVDLRAQAMKASDSDALFSLFAEHESRTMQRA